MQSFIQGKMDTSRMAISLEFKVQHFPDLCGSTARGEYILLIIPLNFKFPRSQYAVTRHFPLPLMVRLKSGM